MQEELACGGEPTPAVRPPPPCAPRPGHVDRVQKGFTGGGERLGGRAEQRVRGPRAHGAVHQTLPHELPMMGPRRVAELVLASVDRPSEHPLSLALRIAHKIRRGVERGGGGTLSSLAGRGGHPCGVFIRSESASSAADGGEASMILRDNAMVVEEAAAAETEVDILLLSRLLLNTQKRLSAVHCARCSYLAAGPVLYSQDQPPAAEEESRLAGLGMPVTTRCLVRRAAQLWPRGSLAFAATTAMATWGCQLRGEVIVQRRQITR